MGDNMLFEEAELLGKQKTEAQQKVEAVGKNIQRVGFLLTLLLTVPIILFVVLGTVGAVIGGVIALLVLVSMFRKKPKESADQQG